MVTEKDVFSFMLDAAEKKAELDLADDITLDDYYLNSARYNDELMEKAENGIFQFEDAYDAANEEQKAQMRHMWKKYSKF